MRLITGMSASFVASFFAWCLGQGIARILVGHWWYTVEVLWIAPVVIVVIELIIGLPVILVLSKVRRAPGWIYALAGATVGLLPLFMLAIIIVNGNPTSDSLRDLLPMYLEGAVFVVLEPSLALYAVAIGAAGGFAYWLATRSAVPR